MPPLFYCNGFGRVAAQLLIRHVIMPHVFMPHVIPPLVIVPHMIYNARHINHAMAQVVVQLLV